MRQETSRISAVCGTVLAGLPLVLPFVFMLLSLPTGRSVRFDYLMPGELFAAALVGGIGILTAALVGRRLRVAAGVALALVATLFVLVGIAAEATGLASGATRPQGWPLTLVVGVYGLYVLAVIAQCVVGVLLCRRLFAPGRQVA